MGKKLCPKEAAKALSVSEHSIRTGIKQGTIPFIKIGNRYLIDVELAEEVYRRNALANMKGVSEQELGGKPFGILRKIGK